MRNVMQSWAPIWYHHSFHEFILICEIIHIVYPHLSLFCIRRVLVWSDYCILWVIPDDWMAWWYLIQAIVLISISCMQETQCNSFSYWHWFQLIYLLWLLIIIMVQSCFMLVGADSWRYICLLLALFFTLYIHSLTEYFIILTPLCFVCGLQVEDTSKRICAKS